MKLEDINIRDSSEKIVNSHDFDFDHPNYNSVYKDYYCKVCGVELVQISSWRNNYFIEKNNNSSEYSLLTCGEVIMRDILK